MSHSVQGTVSSKALEPGDHCTSGVYPGSVPLTLDERATDEASRTFRALGDPARLRLAVRLAHAPSCVTELAEVERESLTTVSQRLRLLRADNIVQRRRTGKHILYSLADQRMADLIADGGPCCRAAQTAPRFLGKEHPT